MKKAAVAVGAVAIVAVAIAVVTLPPPSRRLDVIPSATLAFGGYHIHSIRSDGTGTPDEIAAAAARAGLAFIILTDHGDATRPPDPPAYRHGVLTIDAVEINTDAGHLVALGLNAASPYPLAGAAADVLEDVHRQGGWGVVAHPDSPRENLRWRAWNVPYDGVEWLNADSEWRDEPPLRWPGLLAHLFLRPPETVASIFARPVTTLARWDAAARQRPIVGLAALDAHARLIGWQESDGASGRMHTLVARPSYEDMFRALAIGAVLDAPLSGDARRDSTALLASLHAGHTFSVVRAFAWPGVLTFHAQAGSADVAMGGTLPSGTAVATFHASVAQPPDASLRLVANGRTIATGTAHIDYRGATPPGAYRVEVRLPDSTSMPWMVSNPIYVEAPPPGVIASGEPTPGPLHEIPIAIDANRWHVEKDGRSTGELATDGSAIRLDYSLAAGVPNGQFVAAATALPSSESVAAIHVVGRADHPTRLSVQIKLAGGHDGDRWRRSIYLDSNQQAYDLPLATFEPADHPTTQRPVATTLRALLIVVDTLNSFPGSRGSVWVSGVSLAAAAIDR